MDRIANSSHAKLEPRPPWKPGCEPKVVEGLRLQKNRQVLVRYGPLDGGVFYVGDFMGSEKRLHRLKIKNKEGNINLEYAKYCYEADSEKVARLETMKNRIQEAKRRGVREPLYYFKLKHFRVV